MERDMCEIEESEETPNVVDDVVEAPVRHILPSDDEDDGKETTHLGLPGHHANVRRRHARRHRRCAALRTSRPPLAPTHLPALPPPRVELLMYSLTFVL